jgi:hypothetical protein
VYLTLFWKAFKMLELLRDGGQRFSKGIFEEIKIQSWMFSRIA